MSRARLRVHLVASLLLLAAAAARPQPAGASPDDTTPATSSLDTVTLQLKWKHGFQFAGYYAAIEQGFYRKAGLDVRLREAEEGEDPADVVQRGTADFGIGTSNLVRLRQQGRPFVVLAPIFQHSPFIFLVAEASGVSSIHDLKGRTLMVDPQADELLAYLEYEGIARTSVTLVPHVFGPSALLDGSVGAISAYSTDEPFLLEEAKVNYLTFTPRAAGIDFYGDTLFTTDDEIKHHPDRVKRFRQASIDGWKYALDHSDEVTDLILQKYSQRHTREHLRFEAEAARRLILPDVVEIGYLNPGRWRHIAEVYADLHMMPRDAPITGLLYESAPLDLRRYYVALAVAAGIIGILTFIVDRFRRQASSLQKAIGEIQVLKGILPICANCKSIRDDQGYWNQVEKYISERTGAEFTHGICTKCVAELYGDLLEDRGTTERRVGERRVS